MAVVTHPKPGFKSYLLFVGALIFVKPLLVLWPVVDAGLRQLRWLNKAAERTPDVDGVLRERIELAGRPTDRLVPAEVANDPQTAMLYLHGGAFIACGPGTHREVAGRLSRLLGLPVYVLDYRQLPETGVGGSVHDAVGAYRELLEQRGYRRVIVAGDSAGGFLCGKVIEAAHLQGLPKPAAYVGYSPFLDLDLASNPDSTSRHDAYLPKRKLAKLAPKFYRGPVDFTGVRRITEAPPEVFPPTILITAQDEFLEPDAHRLVENLLQAGVLVHLHSFPWQLHAFPAMGGLTPEGLEAIALSADFANAVLAAADPAMDQDVSRVAGQAG